MPLVETALLSRQRTQRLGPSSTSLLIAGGLVIIAAFLILELFSIHAGFRDYDEGVYWLTLRALARGDPLYRTIFASEPPVFFYTLLPFSALGHSIAAIRFGVVIFGLVGLVAAYAAGHSLRGRVAGWTAVVLAATSPFYFDQSAILQSDLPSVALALLAMALALMGAARRGSIRLALAAGSGFVLALAVGTKLSAALVAVPLLLVLAGARPQPLSSIGSALTGGIAGSVIVLLPIAGAWQAAYQQMIVSHTGAARVLQLPLGANLPLLFLHRGLPLEALAGLGIAIALWRRDWRIVVPAAWAILTAGAILLYQPLFMHHLVQLVPPLALTAAVGFANLNEPGRRFEIKQLAGLGLLLLVAGYGLGVAFRHTEAELRSGTTEALLARALEQATRRGDFVISDNQYVVALANRDIPPEVLDTSRQVIASDLLTLPQLEAAAHRYHVELVLVDGHRLRGLPGFSAWLLNDFSMTQSFGPHTAIYQLH